MGMILQISSEDDLPKLEECVRSTMGAERLDVSVFHSKPFIDAKRELLCLLRNPGPVPQSTTYFHNENLMLRVLNASPLLVWVGHRDVCNYDNEDSI